MSTGATPEIPMDTELRRVMRESSRRWFREIRKRGQRRRHDEFRKEIHRILGYQHTPEEMASILQRQFEDELPGMVQRARNLHSAMLVGATRGRVGRFLSEAIRAYMRRDFNATILLCRSALEGALKQRLTSVAEASKAEN